jgi:hypothetical protein
MEFLFGLLFGCIVGLMLMLGLAIRRVHTLEKLVWQTRRDLYITARTVVSQARTLKQRPNLQIVQVIEELNKGMKDVTPLPSNVVELPPKK